MTRALRDIPAVRALAEREAHERYDAMRGYAEQHPRDPVTGHRRVIKFAWEDDDGLREWWIEAQLALLCDLTRPASRDAVARLVAEALGWPSTPTAPYFEYDPLSPSPRDRDGAPYREDWPERWIFTSSDGNAVEFVAPDDEADEPWFPESWVVVPGLSGSDPAEALALIADAVLT